MNLVSNLFINPDDGDWIDGGNQDGGETDAATLAVDVQHVRVAFCCTIELANKFDVEPFKASCIVVFV